jgi:hypothetical protein
MDDIYTLLQNVVKYAEAKDLEICLLHRNLEIIGSSKEMAGLIRQQNGEIVQLQVESREMATLIRQLETDKAKREIN